MFAIHARRSAPALLFLTALAPILGACADHSTTAPSARPAAGATLAKGLPGGRGRILFVSQVTGGEEIYSMREDGSDIVRLTYSGGYDREAVYSPDGSKIAFVTSRNSQWAVNVYVMNADGTHARQLTPSNTFAQIEGISWAPDGKRIAFSGNSEFLSPLDLYVMSNTGAQMTQLTNTADVSETYPAFSPAGDRIAFGTYTPPSGPANIGVISPDGSNPSILVDCSASGCAHPAWSPDRRYIAFTGFGTPTEVRTLDLWVTGAVPETLVSGAMFPRYSPDGVKLVYTTEGTPVRQVATVTVDGTSPVVLTNFAVSTLATSWGR